MWITDWAGSGGQTCSERPQISEIDPSTVASTYLLAWNEHCVECAVPECYAACPLYVRRLDRKCARFKNGIVPNPNHPGLLPFGAEIEFRRWGKLESTFGYGSVSPAQSRFLDRIDRTLLRLIRPVSKLFRPVSPALRLNGAYAVLRERLLQRITRSRKCSFDEFVIEAWNVKSQPVRLILECWQGGLKFRASLHLETGRTVKRICAGSMNIDLYGRFGVICVYPEKDAEAHLVFSWLDFVRYQQNKQISPGTARGKPTMLGANSSAKVKCVIWDLDRTMWEGILGEQDPAAVTLRSGVLRTMQDLDKKGILQSIASKNDHNDAWSVLLRLGVAELFLHPQINWDPKSVNVQRIVSALNISMDSCAFVDDSSFERAEVLEACPGIRVYTDSEVATLPDLSEFDVPVTEESRRRRFFYRAETQRKEEAVHFGDRYDAFLRSCALEAVLFRPKTPEHFERCLELLHRSNQLNLSTHRYSREEFARLLVRRDVLCVCTSCRDRFGEYGVVGFASMESSNREIVLKDFVLSCRVAQKKVENAWFRWLGAFASAADSRKISATCRRTPRNAVLLNTLLEVGFTEREKNDIGSVLDLSSDQIPPSSDIVSIVTHDLEPTQLASLKATG